MIDKLSTSVRQLILAQTEEELSHAAATALDQLLGADESTVIPAEDCMGNNQAWASTGSLDVSGQGPLISGVIGQSYASRESWIVDDLTETRSASAGSPPHDPTQYRSLLCVPVDEWGVLIGVAHDAGAFSESDLEAVELLQSYVAAAFTRITSRKRQEDGDIGVQEVADILAHDVRNPLTVANGHLELAREEHDSKHLTKVAKAHDRLEELIDDVVALSHTDEHVDTTESIDIQEIAERAWAMVETSDAELIVDESLTSMADESYLCQLFENLFRNAVTHGGPAVTVRVGALTDRTGFYVSDDGPGIPPKEREIVFQRGYSDDTYGTGLGLFIVKNIVDAHGWDITVTESNQGGARFEILIEQGIDRGTLEAA